MKEKNRDHTGITNRHHKRLCYLMIIATSITIFVNVSLPLTNIMMLDDPQLDGTVDK